MKKVKTIITTLLIIFASAFMTACSCGGSDPDIENLVLVYPTKLEITSDHESTTTDEETKYISLSLNLGEEFKITYELSPLNVNVTQVNWTFIEGDDVLVSKSNSYSYSQERTHTITFVTKKTGRATIEFRTKESNNESSIEKVTYAYVVVGESEKLLPTLVEVSKADIGYNPDEGLVTWRHVTQQRLHNNEIKDLDVVNGQVSGLYGYELEITNLQTDSTEIVKIDDPTINYYKLPRGSTYAVRVRALGDDHGIYMKSGSYPKETFRFHQLATVTGLANDNGLISYNAPLYADQNEIYYSADESPILMTNSSTNSFICTEIPKFQPNSEYQVSVRSIPNRQTFNGTYSLDAATDTRYYPSVKCEPIIIQYLAAPRLAMEYFRGPKTLDGVLFGNNASFNNPHLGTKINWTIPQTYPIEYDTRFVYSIIKDGVVVASNETEEMTYDISSLRSKPGDYVMSVYTLGRASNTIQSSITEFNFRVLGKMDENSAVVSNNVLTTASAPAIIQGVDLYFRGNTLSNSQHIYVSTGNLDSDHISVDLHGIENFELAPDTYKVYANYVGFDGNGKSAQNTSTTGDYSLIFEDLVITPKVNDISLSKEAVLKFKNIDNYNNYRVSLCKTGESHTIDQIISWSGLVEGALNENLRYTTKDNYNYINVYDILKAYFIGRAIPGMNDPVTEENFDTMMLLYMGTNQFEYKITALGNNNNILDSRASQSKTFAKRAGANVTSFSNNVLTFEGKKNANYHFDFNGASFDDSLSADSISINFNSMQASKDSVTDELINFVDRSGVTNKVTITIMGSDDGSFINSYPTSYYIHLTETISNIDMERNGDLIWSTSRSEGQTFLLTIYDENGNVINIDNVEYKDLAIAASPYVTEPVEPPTEEPGEDPEEGGEGEGEGDENLEPQDSGEESEPQVPSTSNNLYFYNINSYIDAIYASLGNVKLGFSIEVVESNKFTGLASDAYYAYRLPEVAMTKVEDASRPAIKYTTLSSNVDLQYKLDVYKDGEVILTKNDKVETKDAGNNVIKVIGNGLDLPLTTVGTYELKLSVYSQATEDNGLVEFPMVLNSSETSETIIVIDKSIKISTDGTNVVWNHINPQVTYSITYDTTTVNVGSNTSYEVQTKLTAGEHLIVVTPNTVYTTSGIVFINDVSDNPITKLPAVLKSTASATTENGALLFTITDDLTTIADLNIQLLVNGNNASTDDYKVEGLTASTINIKVLGHNYIGEKTYSLGLSAPGYISSDTVNSVGGTNILTYNAIKLDMVDTEFFKKNGGYIEWKHLDNATHYDLSFVQAGGDTPVTIKFEYDNGSIKIEETTGSNTFVLDPAKVTLNSGIIKYLFDEEIFGTSGMKGEYYYNVTANTITTGYLNGNVSANLSIFKLDNTIAVSTDLDNIVLSGYIAEIPSMTPTHIEYTINRIDSYTPEGETEAVDYTVQSKTVTVEFTNAIAVMSADAISGYYINLNTITADNLDKEGTKIGTGPFLNGKYEIIVKFIGNGNEQITSNEVRSTDYIERLETAVLGTKAGVITWQKINNATDYSIEIIGNDNTYIIHSLTLGADSNTPAPAEEGEGSGAVTEVQLTEADIRKHPSGEFATFKFVPGVNYQVRVMANSTGKISGVWSEKFTVTKLLAPTALDIIRAEDKSGAPRISWKNPNDTTIRQNFEYGLNFSDDTPDTTFKIGEYESTTSNYIANLTTDKIAGDYELKLRVIGNTVNFSQLGLLTSNYSGEDIFVNDTESDDTTGDDTTGDENTGDGSTGDEITGDDTTGGETEPVTPPTTPIVQSKNPIAHYRNDTTNVGYKDGLYTWDNVEGAYAYRLTFSSIDNPDNAVFITYTTTNSYEFRNTTFAEYGYLKLTVNALTDCTRSIISTVESTLNNYNWIYKTNSINEVYVKDGQIAWSVEISDIHDYLKTHYNNQEKSVLYDYFNTSPLDPTVKLNLSENDFYTVVKAYIIGKIGGVAVEETPEAVDTILSHLLKFRLSVTTDYTRDVDGSQVTEQITTELEITPASAQIVGSQLVYKYDLAQEPIVIVENEEEKVIDPGKYTINVSAIGNRDSSSQEQMIIATTDSMYNLAQNLDTFKPLTPESWISESLSTGAQIVNGELLWRLVTTDDSTVDNLKYHEKYEITITSTGNNEERYSTIVDINDDYESISSVKNPSDDHFYRRDLASLFGNEEGFRTNQNYAISIKVSGTADSRLDSTAKAYLNSNSFVYTDHFNILENLQVQVKDSTFSWSYSEDSTATKVYIYGPFDYAPDRANYLTEDLYNAALKTWKESIATAFNATTPIELEFPANSEDGSARPSSFTLTDDSSFAPGSYIIRKQEVGNGKGVYDTPYSDQLFIKEDDPTEPYGVIATKLAPVTTSRTLSSEELWAYNGRFEWETVELANAYRVILDKIIVNGEEIILQASKDAGIITSTYVNGDKTYAYYEMPEDVNFNDIDCQYRIHITALRIEMDGTITENYFNSDIVTTSSYNRVSIPSGITMDGTGLVQWSHLDESVQNYQVRVNANDATVTLDSSIVVSSLCKYNMSKLEQNGTMQFAVRAMAKTNYLNSMYAPALTVTKLPDPATKIKNGVFDWKTASSEASQENPAKSFLQIADEANIDATDNKQFMIEETYDVNVIDYPLYTTYEEIFETYDETGYTYDLDAEPYAPGKYQFSVQFLGTEGNYDYSTPGFVISSSVESYIATKLPAPELQNIDFSSNEAIGTGNRLKWTKIDNSQEYMVLVVAKGATPDTNTMGLWTSIDNWAIESDLADARMFIDDGTNIILKLESIIDYFRGNLNLEDSEGIDIDVYVQAIGTEDSTVLASGTPVYLSSSYSVPKTISIPGSPVDYDYSASTGLLTWNIDDSTKNNNFNTIVSMEYSVNNVSYEDYIAYWQITSDEYYELGGDKSVGAKATSDTAQANRFNEVISRKIKSVTTDSVIIGGVPTIVYDIVVYDTVFLQGNGSTPTSYQLTNVAENYQFDIVITVGDENYDGMYRSAVYEIRDAGINFSSFGSGDGSTLYPYTIASSLQLNNVRNFTDKHFRLISNIAVSDSWNIIEDEFTGSIDGAGYAIAGSFDESGNITSNMNINTVAIVGQSGYSNAYMSFIRKIAEGAVIKNLTLAVNVSLTGNNDYIYGNIYAAGLSAYNYGSIENVKVQGRLVVANNSTRSTSVAGMTVYNYGEISESSVVVGSNENSSVANKNGIYVYDILTSPAKAGGMVVFNYSNATIDNSFFNGHISANEIGGIVVDNVGGLISKCYAEGIAEVNDNYSSRAIYGGIAATVYNNTQIRDSYSLMTVYIYKASSSTAYVGGIAGYIDSYTETATISNNYVVVDFRYASGSTNNNVNAYAFMDLNTVVQETITFTNNYFVKSENSSVNTNAPEEVNNADDQVINAVDMSGLKEKLDKTIFDVSGDYPVHKN